MTGGMDVLEWAMERLPNRLGEWLSGLPEDVTELRMRVGSPIEVVCGPSFYPVGEVLSAQDVRGALHALLEYSAYAREEDLKKGFFTLPDGCRVGVCGRWTDVFTHAGSLCLRAARQIPGCADKALPCMYRDGRPKSVLVLSPPGFGKTTLLRDMARSMSLGNSWGAAAQVAIADERGEIAACYLGVPTLDVGRADVTEGLGKARAVELLVRAMSPQVIVTDEIGAPEDALALCDAARCGVRIVASAHAGSVGEAKSRKNLREVMGLFDCFVVLAGQIGQIGSIEENDGI